MSNTIRNFIVGIGYDYDEKGQQRVGAGIDSIQSKALKLGAVVAGAFGINKLTSDFAATNDELGKFAKALGLDVTDVAALGDALEYSGGSAAGLRSQLTALAEMRAGLLTGDAGWIEAVSKAEIDHSLITDAENATDAYLALADAFAMMNTDQRINAANALGFDQASILLLSNGRDEVEKLMTEMTRIRPRTAEMAEDAAEFNDQMKRAGDNIGAIADKISVRLLPQVNNVLETVNEWFSDENVGYIDGLLNRITGDEGVETAVTGVASVGALALGAPLAPVLAGAAGAELWDWNAADVKDATGIELPEWMFKPIGELFSNNDASNVVESKQITNSERSTVETHRETVSRVQQPPSQPQNINVTLNLDGQVIEQKIISVQERQNQNTIDDLESSIKG